MSAEIAPGSFVSVEIVSTPRNQAAAKTLRRICSKDAAIAKLNRTRKAQRPSWEEWRRGGMMWHHQMKSRSAVSLERGRCYTVKASVDVLRDLNSVTRWVKVVAK